MPSSLIEQQHGVRSGRHRDCDLGEMERHALGVAAGQDEAVDSDEAAPSFREDPASLFRDDVAPSD